MSLSQIASTGFYKKQKVLAHLLIKFRCCSSKSSPCVFKVANVILLLIVWFKFLYLQNCSPNKQFKTDKKQLAVFTSFNILTNYCLPLNMGVRWTLKNAFKLTCRLFNKGDVHTSVELVAMIWTLLIALFFHSLALYVVFTFNFDTVIQENGKLLLFLSLIVFSACYFYLTYHFKKWFK
jgi:hypothetical protein